VQFGTEYTQVNGAKTLVLDPSIAGPLGLVTDVSLLKVKFSPVIRSSELNKIAAPWCGQDVLA
jgi:hypothetical protein